MSRANIISTVCIVFVYPCVFVTAQRTHVILYKNEIHWTVTAVTLSHFGLGRCLL